MSDSDSAKTGGTTSGSQRTTNAILGIFVLLAIVVLANYVFNRVSHRFDLYPQESNVPFRNKPIHPVKKLFLSPHR